MKIFLNFLLLFAMVSCNESHLVKKLPKTDLSDDTKVATEFVTKWKIGEAGFGDGGKTLTLPLVAGYEYDFEVDWGDGESSRITDISDDEIQHTYSVPGEYTVSITGRMEAWAFMNPTTLANLHPDANKLIEVVSLGDLSWKNLAGAFGTCTKLQSFAGGITKNVTNMRGMFKGAASLVSLDLSSFETREVTDMAEMFRGLSVVKNLDLKSFNTSKVTNMANMFFWLNSLTQIDISSFDTRNVTSMYRMFYSCTSLTSLNLSHFDVSNVVDMRSMLSILTLSSLNTNNWVLNPSANTQFIFNVTTIESLYCDSPTMFGKVCI